MLIVHHLENSRSQRILWLLEELGLEYQIKHYKRDPETNLAPPELRQVHPLGKAPVLTDGDVTVAESAAIIEYIADTYGDSKMRPADGTPERRSYIYWLHYAEGSLLPLLLLSLVMTRVESKSPMLIRPIARKMFDGVRSAYLDPNLERHLTFINDTLGASPWFCGEQLTAADCQMSYALDGAEVRTDLRANYANIANYLDRIRARPAYQAAIAKGGPYSLMSGK